MLTHLLVMVDRSAPSFCHYTHDCRQSGLMPLATLERAMDFANSRGLALTFLLGRTPLPVEYEAVLGKTEHAKIVPAALAERYPEAVLVLDARRERTEEDLAGGKRRVIVTVPKEQLADMAAVLDTCLGHSSRLDVSLSDADRYSDEDLSVYEQQLGLVAERVGDRYLQGELLEVNIISDRMLLRAMNNCGAGVTHVTAAPNGRFYICPGFYYDDENSAVGSLADGLAIPNGQLLKLENAPICSRCDAYHCKRCVYLNARTTLEWNTPSRQQCVLAHLERNAARAVQGRLGAVAPFSCQARIPAIDYLDPLELITGGGDGDE